jgi:hypothetical protein
MQVQSYNRTQLIAELKKVSVTPNPELELCYGYSSNSELVVVEAFFDWTDKMGPLGYEDLYLNQQLVPAHICEVNLWLIAY